MHQGLTPPRPRRKHSAAKSTAIVVQPPPPPPMTMEERKLNAMAEYHDAFIKMAQEMPKIDKDGKIQLFKNGAPLGKPIAYVSFENLLDVVQPILLRHGIRASFHGVRIEGEFWIHGVTHRGIYYEETFWPVDREAKSPAMSPGQATAAGATLACRHALMKLLAINSHAPEDRDSDGAATIKIKTINAKQRKELVAAQQANSVPTELFEEHFGPLAELPAKDFARALKACVNYVPKEAPTEEQTNVSEDTIA